MPDIVQPFEPGSGIPAAVASRLDALRPVLARNAAQGAADRRLPDESLDALAEAGVLRLLVPNRYRGYQASTRAVLETLAAVAEADGSAGWVAAIWQSNVVNLGLFSRKAQDEVFGPGPDIMACGSVNPVGTSEQADGGWRVTGRWSYVSGSLHGQWAVLGFMVPEGAPGGPDARMALIPMAGLTIHDTWRMAGMRATGSNTVTCEDVFVPDHRVLRMADALAGEYPAELGDEAAYRSWMPTLGLLLTSPLLGIARAALEHVRSAAGEKGIPATTFRRQADSPGFQIRLAEAAQRVDTAYLHALRAADDIDRYAALRIAPDFTARARIRADLSTAGGHVTGAISALLDAHGSGGFAEASPLHRMWQDANVAARHVLFNPAVDYELYGKALLGIDNTITFAV